MSRWTSSHYATCRSKVRYRNKAKALHMAGVLKQWPYKCECCDGWHMTSRYSENLRAE